MDVCELKRKIAYDVEGRMLLAEVEFFAQDVTRKAVRRSIFEQILDTADAIRRDYGQNLENFK